MSAGPRRAQWSRASSASSPWMPCSPFAPTRWGSETMAPEHAAGDRLRAWALTLAFGKRIIQRELSFVVRPGSIFALMGGSGCGKSTVLKAMVGLLRPAAGTVLVDGEDYWAAAEEERIRIGR